MTGRPGWNRSPAFKAKVALTAIRGEQTLVELSQQLTCMRTRSSNGKISVLMGRQVFLAMMRRLQGGVVGRQEMIDRSHKLPVARPGEAFWLQSWERVLFSIFSIGR